MSNTIDYVSEIIKFNNDPEIIALREKYNEPTFFEVIAKDRSETTYSAFLKWMFQDCVSGKNTISPILQLLNILVKRSQEQKDGSNESSPLIDNDLRNACLSGGVKIKDIIVETELSISEYKERVKKENGTLDIELEKKENKSKEDDKDEKNRLDIFIDCNVEIPTIQNINRLQIIIENKIDSSHGKDQTQRYYNNTKRIEENILQLYVYLSPSTKDRKDIDELHKQFIPIEYQDILDNIINPILSSSSLAQRSRFFLEEFKNQLTYPNLDSGQLSIAIGKENTIHFTSLFVRYEELILHSAITSSSKEFYRTNGEEKAITMKSSRGKNEKIDIENNACDLLYSFWEQNRKLLLAVMNGIKDEQRQNIEELIKEVSKRQISRYRIYNQDKELTEYPVGNAIAARIIIQEWVNTQNVVDLELLRKKISRDVNPYYSSYHSNLFKYLFYEYRPKAKGITDDSNLEYEYDHEDFPKDKNSIVRGWDIDFRPEEKNEHIIYLNSIDATKHKVIMLKMWRKNGVEELIKHVLKHQLIPGLKVEEVANNRVIKTYQKEK